MFALATETYIYSSSSQEFPTGTHCCTFFLISQNRLVYSLKSHICCSDAAMFFSANKHTVVYFYLVILHNLHIERYLVCYKVNSRFIEK